MTFEDLPELSPVERCDLEDLWDRQKGRLPDSAWLTLFKKAYINPALGTFPLAQITWKEQDGVERGLQCSGSKRRGYADCIGELVNDIAARVAHRARKRATA